VGMVMCGDPDPLYNCPPALLTARCASLLPPEGEPM
jgi:hypothetical protein